MTNYEKYFGTPERAAENIHRRNAITRSYLEYIRQEYGDDPIFFNLNELFDDAGLILQWLQEKADA